jgi:plasmid stabilization system protein ParE
MPISLRSLPGAAQRLATELEVLADSLAEMPGRGRRVEGDARELVAGRYLLRYRVAGDQVVIVRVKHSAQSG